MPFSGPAHEQWMMINKPVLWRKWVKKYGHAKGFKAKLKKSARKAVRTRKRRVAKRKVRRR